MIAEMSFWDHIGELRKRILRAVIGVGVGFAVSYYFSEELFGYLMDPLCKAFGNAECKLQALGLMEGFIVYLKVGIVGGIFLAAPWIFYQLWSFIRPGLKERERRYVIPFVLSASVMFIGGAVFGYWVIFPLAFEFFINSLGPNIVMQPNMDAYFNLSATLLIGLGLLFEIPVIVVLFHSLGLVEAKSLWKSYRYAIVVIFIVAALFPTTDPLSLFLLAAPLSILYTITLVICSLKEAVSAKA